MKLGKEESACGRGPGFGALRMIGEVIAVLNASMGREEGKRY